MQTITKQIAFMGTDWKVTANCSWMNYSMLLRPVVNWSDMLRINLVAW